MNRTVAFVAFVTLAGLALIGSLVILVLKPDASATFTAFIIQILGLVTVAAGTFAMLGKQGQKIETIEKNTNGNLSRLLDENARLTQMLAEKKE